MYYRVTEYISTSIYTLHNVYIQTVQPPCNRGEKVYRKKHGKTENLKRVWQVQQQTAEKFCSLPTD